MNYFDATFYNRYTALTLEQIREKLTPVRAPEGAGPGWEGLAGREYRLVQDNGLTLRYFFGRDTLTMVENGGEPVEAPYAARELCGIVLVSHMIPGTVRGYNLILDEPRGLTTVYEVWFGGFEPDKREVWREYSFGYIDTGAEPPAERHSLTNRIEGTGTHWNDDDGREMLYFFPSVIWSAYIELSNPKGGITITAPSDFFKIDDSLYIYSRAEQEYSGCFTLEVIDMMTVRHIGVRLGFDINDELDYRMYEGSGEWTGRSTNLEILTDYGTKIPFSEQHLKVLAAAGKGARPSYRPRFMHKDYTQEEVDEIIRTNTRLFKGTSIMTSRNTMEVTEYMVGKKFILRYDDSDAWEYEIIDRNHLKWRLEGSEEWQEELYEGFEAAKDLVIFSHICTGSKPLRCPTHSVDFSNALATVVDAKLGNGRKPWEIGHEAKFGVLEIEGGPTPPVTRRHGFTRELLGKAYAWTYGDHMQSIHCYTSPESYSWTIILAGNTGGFMWSSPCLYVKLREDAYLMSWTEDACNGNQGIFILNPRLMHDAGFFFGIGDTEGTPDLHLHAMGAFARPLAGFDLDRYFEERQK